MPNQRDKSKALVAAWIPKTLKRALQTSAAQNGDTVTELVEKLIQSAVNSATTDCGALNDAAGGALTQNPPATTAPASYKKRKARRRSSSLTASPTASRVSVAKK